MIEQMCHKWSVRTVAKVLAGLVGYYQILGKYQTPTGTDVNTAADMAIQGAERFVIGMFGIEPAQQEQANG